MKPTTTFAIKRRGATRMPRRLQRGIALLESLLAVLLLSIGLIGTLALQARSVGALADTALRAEATIAANGLLGVMSNDQGNLALYALGASGAPNARLMPWLTELRKNLPGASVRVTVTPAADTSRTQVLIWIGWQRTSSGPANEHRIISYLAAAQ
jgi:type IV pilus assembly protein PilV